MILDESANEDVGRDPGTAASDPFGPARAPDPFFAPPKKRKRATRAAVAAVSPEGEQQYGAGLERGGGIVEDLLRALGMGQAADPSLPADEYVYGGKTYTFKPVNDPRGGMVKDYSASDPNAEITGGESGPVLGNPSNQMSRQLEMLLGGVQNAQDLSPHEYDKLTQLASNGNKLAQQILVKGNFKAQDYPSLSQDITKMTDPFVQALSNLPNAANAAEAQVAAVTAPYDFSNAEGQVNNILKNQGFAQLAQPSAATSAYVGKLNQIASGNPLTDTNPVLQALGVPTIESALKGLGPAAKAYQKALPNQAMLGILLNRIQSQDVYGSGLTSKNALGPSAPNWLQELLASITSSTYGNLGGALPGLNTIAQSLPGSGQSTPAQPSGYP